MKRKIHRCGWLLLVAWLAVPQVTQAQNFFSQRDLRPRGPKTLLEWSNAVESDEPEEENPRIITDRPHLAEAASLVGLGRIQVETGYTFTLDNDSATNVQRHSFPEPLFRIGMFREWFEFRFGYNYLVEETVDPTGRTVLSGSDDIYVGAKIALAEQSGILPEFTVFPQMRVPSGHPNFTSSEVLPGMNFAYAWMITEKLELEVNTVLNRKKDDGLDHYYVELFQPINFEYDLHEKLMLFNEFILFSPIGALDASCQYYQHAGFHFFILPNLQYDLHAGFGLNRAAHDFFGGNGLSWRW